LTREEAGYQIAPRLQNHRGKSVTMIRARIAEAWNAFSLKAGLQAAPDNQRREMRRAFYAGATATFYIVTTDISAGPEPQPSDLQMLSDLDAELRRFVECVKSGTA
jgi:hypothetical protein